MISGIFLGTDAVSLTMVNKKGAVLKSAFWIEVVLTIIRLWFPSSCRIVLPGRTCGGVHSHHSQSHQVHDLCKYTSSSHFL